jgi:hypothetical protein
MKLVSYFFEEDEIELVESYATLLKVAAISALVTFIAIIL